MEKPCQSPAWLASAVLYEVYPQSFLDSNADGIGDLPGIIQKLDYIQSLGCNTLWLNPCFESPFQDAGYDISDFYKVAPRYGTNEDLYELFRQIKQRGMRVVLDLVAGHTSTEHPWFKASCQREPNKYSNWYIWTSKVWETAPPPLQQVNGFCERDGNYVTNFFHFQPALNYGFAKPDPARPWQLSVDHSDVQAVHHELRKIMTFWLERGVDGFRVDMAASLIKLDDEQKAMIAFWRKIRAWMETAYPDAVLIAEWSMPRTAIEAGFHVDFMIHFGARAYTPLFRAHTSNDVAPPSGPSFFHSDGEGDIIEFLDEYLQHYTLTKGRGYICLPTGNHDISRIRGSRCDDELKVAYAFLLTMPGLPCIYQGDEIGMRHIDGLPSKEGGYCRTGARTPMQWNSKPNAGFSTAASRDLYLPIDPDIDRPTVEDQETDKESVLNFVRTMVKMRSTHPALAADADFEVLYAEKNKYPFVYMRISDRGERLVIAVNPSSDCVTAEIPAEKLPRLGEQLLGFPVSARMTRSSLEMPLPRYSYAIFRVPVTKAPSHAEPVFEEFSA